VSYASDVISVARGSGFRRLLSIRMAGQLADGVFQTAVASYVLFSPERQTDARSIAGAFAILLLPYSVLGPFAGVLIDRWRRRQILLAVNLLRAVLVIGVAFIALSPAPETVLLAVGVLAISANRLVLASLGASIPRVVPLDKVIVANAIAPTFGTLATVVGAGLGVGLRHVAGDGGDSSDAVVMACAAGLYLMAALLTLRLSANSLGPDDQARIDDTWSAIKDVSRGLVEGLRHIGRIPAATDAFVVTAAQRFGFGVATVTTVLLVRNTFAPASDPNAGLNGLAQAVGIVGLGFFLGAVITPALAEVIGTRRTIAAALALGAVTQWIIAFPLPKAPLLGAAFVIGVVSQSIKVGVDSILQRAVEDEFLGRTFALYDVVFNVFFVGAAVVGAFTLPATGRSPGLMIVVGFVYAATSWFYLRRSDRAL